MEITCYTDAISVSPIVQDKNTISMYFARETEDRKIRLIEKEIDQVDSIIDLGCGNGNYAKALRLKCRKLIGIDMSVDLAHHCRLLDVYDEILQTTVPPIKADDNSVDILFASEVLEHVADLKGMRAEMDRVSRKKIILTVPNPIYPFFYEDPTHVLKYSIKSLVHELNKSKKFKFKARGLGFENIPGTKWIKRLTQVLLRPFPGLNPTVSIIGIPRSKKG